MSFSSRHGAMDSLRNSMSKKRRSKSSHGRTTSRKLNSGNISDNQVSTSSSSDGEADGTFFGYKNRPKAPLIRSQPPDTASLSSLRSSFASPVPPPVPSRIKRRESFEHVPEVGFLGAISRLKGELEYVQKKTFTKWINSQLRNSGFKVLDLFHDLRDGIILIKLLEIVSGETLPKPTKGSFRIHNLENVDKALGFLFDQQVHLENIGAHDIVGGNERLTLGLVWTIILRFQIQKIQFEDPRIKALNRSAKDSLLLWCQLKTAEYGGVHVRNFSTSWKDGLAFNALIHKHRPDLIHYESLDESNAFENLQNAFDVAENEFGIERLLDPEDFNVEHPDEKSVITYIVSYYIYFTKLKHDNVQGKRISKAVEISMEFDQKIEEYNRLFSDLLHWIQTKIEILTDRRFPNSLSGLKVKLQEFNSYRKLEKPPKFIDRGNLEVMLFTLQSKMRASNRAVFSPKDGKTISDINKAWDFLEKAEHDLEISLRMELLRQERLDQLAKKFVKKSTMRCQWLKENQELLTKRNFGTSLASVDAAAQKHEALENEIASFEGRVKLIVDFADELESEGYQDIDEIIKKREDVIFNWNHLLELLKERRNALDLHLQKMELFQEMEDIGHIIKDFDAKLELPDLGCNLEEIDNLMQVHAIIEADINILGDRIKQVVNNASNFAKANSEHLNKEDRIVEKSEMLDKLYQELVSHTLEKRERLDKARVKLQILWQITQAENWIKEKQHLLSAPDTGHDFASSNNFLIKLNALRKEAREYLESLRYSFQEDEFVLKSLKSFWEKELIQIDQMFDALFKKIDQRQSILEDKLNFFQLKNDAHEADTWILDMIRVVTSSDSGYDDYTTKKLLSKHLSLMGDVKNFESTLDNLHKQSAQLLAESLNSEAQDILILVEDHMEELIHRTIERERMLSNAVAYSSLMNSINGANQWIAEKAKSVNALFDGRDLDDHYVMSHRFESIEKDMVSQAGNISMINQSADELLRESNTFEDLVLDSTNLLNRNWDRLCETLDQREDELLEAQNISKFNFHCSETVLRIETKIKQLTTFDGLQLDISGIKVLQRNLRNIEKEKIEMEDRISELRSFVDDDAFQNHPEATLMKKRLVEITRLWKVFIQKTKICTTLLEDVGEIQDFLKNLDHFQLWLNSSEHQLIKQGSPTCLADSELMLKEHNDLHDEMKTQSPKFEKLIKQSEIISKDPKTYGDPQFALVKERLKAVENDWQRFQLVWTRRQEDLSENNDLLKFTRLQRQVELTQTQHEHFLTNNLKADNLDQVEALIKVLESKLITLKIDHEKADHLEDLASKLTTKYNFPNDKILLKAANLAERSRKNLNLADTRLKEIHDQLKVYQYLQICEEFHTWLEEKRIFVEEDTYRSSKTLRGKWTRHQDVATEIENNRQQLEDLQAKAEVLLATKPEESEIIIAKVRDLTDQFENLVTMSNEKKQKLFDSRREGLYDQTCRDIENFVTTFDYQILDDPIPENLTTVNIMVQKLEKIDIKMQRKTMLIEELKDHTSFLVKSTPEHKDLFKLKTTKIVDEFETVLKPWNARKQQLLMKKKILQFLMDAEREKSWIYDNLELVYSNGSGENLAETLKLISKHEIWRNEVENHVKTTNSVIEDGENIADSNHPQKETFRDIVLRLKQMKEALEDSVRTRSEVLSISREVFEFFLDVKFMEDFMTEKISNVGNEDCGSDEKSWLKILNRFEDEEILIDQLQSSISNIKERANFLLKSNVAESSKVLEKSEKISEMYKYLTELTKKRSSQLKTGHKTFELHHWILECLEWIHWKKNLTKSNEFGQGIDHLSHLITEFQKFSDETLEKGFDDVTYLEKTAEDSTIQDSPYKDLINSWLRHLLTEWETLQNAINERHHLLQLNFKRFKYFADCNDVLDEILETSGRLTTHGRQEIHLAKVDKSKILEFDYCVKKLGSSVKKIQSESSKLQDKFPSENAVEIEQKEKEVVDSYLELEERFENFHALVDRLQDATKFFAMSTNLLNWMRDTVAVMKGMNKPRNVCEVEFLLDDHQNLKEKIDKRTEDFQNCIYLGQKLVAENHPKSDLIKVDVFKLDRNRNDMLLQWDECRNHLELIYEVYQFSERASLAEYWLRAQERLLNMDGLGNSLEEVNRILDKIDAIEKTVKMQASEFESLQRLTKFEKEVIRQRKSNSEKQPVQDYPSTNGQPPLLPPRRRGSTSPRPPDEVKYQSKSGNKEQNGLSVPIRRKGSTASEELRTQNQPNPISPFRSFRVGKKSPQPISNLERSDSTLTQDVTDSLSSLTGLLNRKHVRENRKKKATNRSWEQVYAVLKDNELVCYKSNTPSRTYKESHTISLSEAEASPATDYKKKRNVFHVWLEDGGEYLFEAKSYDEMEKWVAEINKNSPDEELTFEEDEDLPPYEPEENQSKRRSFFLSMRL